MKDWEEDNWDCSVRRARFEAITTDVRGTMAVDEDDIVEAKSQRESLSAAKFCRALRREMADSRPAAWSSASSLCVTGSLMNFDFELCPTLFLSTSNTSLTILPTRTFPPCPRNLASVRASIRLTKNLLSAADSISVTTALAPLRRAPPCQRALKRPRMTRNMIR